MEVELSSAAVENDGCTVVGSSGVLSGGEGAEPFTGALARLPDLRHPLPPTPLSHTSVLELTVIRPSFALTLPTIPVAAVITTATGGAGGCGRTVAAISLVRSGGGGGNGLGVLVFTVHNLYALKLKTKLSKDGESTSFCVLDQSKYTTL